MPDLKFGTAIPTDSERAAVDNTISFFGPATIEVSERMVYAGRNRAVERRHLLLPALHALQRAAGWISPGGLTYACRALEVPPAEAYGVATFYHLFTSETPNPEKVFHVCDDIACCLAGSTKLIEDLTEAGYETRSSPCLGQCERGPAIFVQRIGAEDKVIVEAKPPLPKAELEIETEAIPIAIPQIGSAKLKLLSRIGVVDPTSLDDYRKHGGYAALEKALEIGNEAVIEEVVTSKLLGRGGAAFPTGIKWKAVADQKKSPHYLVCNADESEPGTFKDRILMEGDPFAIVESMTIAGLAVGAEKGWLYIRGEYPVATSRMSSAIAMARESGLLGERIAGSNKKFDIELRSGAGAYICGEETALFNSIEGFRGEPRNKPPFPTTNGLFDQPTVVNNVETLANIPWIVLRGGKSFASEGTENSSGTRLFCVSGRVANPGIYEFEFGITLGEVLEFAGGFSGTGNMKTILLGGAAGNFVSPESTDLPLTFEDTRKVGVALGSGVVMVFSDEDDLTGIVRRIASFFRSESCGQCVPCRVGTVRQEELLVRIGNKKLKNDELSLFEDLATVMSDASICGLGHTASSAIRSALNLGLMETNQ